eukprot:TRINITY_DN682_c0_g1_i1.p1 TRINITY_DN682_c0_g1~~TRINITY_DN682_c0_g1_i1.p1  ORF type:complete len:1010 (+),score=318.71 TRINITY_DN682_c0_g1_i1:116-3031(+)
MKISEIFALILLISLFGIMNAQPTDDCGVKGLPTTVVNQNLPDIKYNPVINPDEGDFSIFPVAGNSDTDKLNVPTTMLFTPDGRILIGEKCGVVRVITADGKLSSTSWIDLSDRVNCAGDKGLTGMTLDPKFSQNGYVYLTYPLWQPGDRDLNRVTQGIVARYTEASGVSSPTTEKVIVGAVNGTGFPSCHNSHVTGDVAFGLDGTLFVAAGEGSHWDAVDDGTDYCFDPYDWQCAPFFGAENDVGSFRAQLKSSLGGKVIRIDPNTGHGIGSTNFPNLVPNPFFDAQNPDSPASKIWSLGHRNPWKLKVRPDGTSGPGTVYLAEVGAKDWEEINVIKPDQRGGNYGWPCFSGDHRYQPWFTVKSPIPDAFYPAPAYPTYQKSADLCNANLDQLRNDSNPYGYNIIDPLFFWARAPKVFNVDTGILGNCAGDLEFYNGTEYPSSYRPQQDGSRALFFSDFGAQWIKVIFVDKEDHIIKSKGIQTFLDNAGSVITIKASPINGDLYFVVQEGEVYRIQYTKGYVGPPAVQVSSNPSQVNIANGPATIKFSSDGSFDTAGLPLSFKWDFGDGTTSTDANPSHTFTTGGAFTVKLTVTSLNGYSSEATTSVRTDNSPPTVALTQGTNFVTFDATSDYTFAATSTDDSTPLTNLQRNWAFKLVHNNHYHPDVAQTAGNGDQSQITYKLNSLVSKYERNMLEITFSATDDKGATGSLTVRAVPNYTTNTAPTADYKLTQSLGMTVNADATLSSDPETDFLDYSWNWGDGSTGSGPVTYHTYDKAGTYTVELVVTDPWTLSSKKSSSFVVAAAAVTDYTNTNTKTFPTLAISSTTTSTGVQSGSRGKLTVYGIYSYDEAKTTMATALSIAQSRITIHQITNNSTKQRQSQTIISVIDFSIWDDGSSVSSASLMKKLQTMVSNSDTSLGFKAAAPLEINSLSNSGDTTPTLGVSTQQSSSSTVACSFLLVLVASFFFF